MMPRLDRSLRRNRTYYQPKLVLTTGCTLALKCWPEPGLAKSSLRTFRFRMNSISMTAATARLPRCRIRLIFLLLIVQKQIGGSSRQRWSSNDTVLVCLSVL
jgi:hypothetical protein